MNKVWICGLLALLFAAAPVWAADKASGGTEKAVKALEEKWLESQKKNDTELLAPLLADKFVETSSEGKVSDRKGTLERAKATKWTSVDYDDLKVTVFGNTAVATGTFNGKGTDDKGKAMDEKERFTDTWVKMPSGQWQCVASQTSPIK